MSLARAWTRQLYGASGAALLVPGTVMAALLLLAIAGGVGGFGALGQAFAGPAAPPGELAATTNGTAAPLVPVPGAGTGATLVASTVAAGPATGLASVGAGNTTPQGNNHNNRHNHSNHHHTTTGGPTTHPVQGATAGGTITPGPAPTAWDSLVGLGTSITRRLPGPVGTLTTHLLDSVGATLNHLLPIGNRSSPATAPSAPATAPSAPAQVKLPGLAPIQLPAVQVPLLHLS
jgi:hypothetical protein